MFHFAFNKRFLSDNLSTTVMVVLGFWLSASCFLDFVIIPALSMGGMMSAGGFVSAGFMLFETFNRFEILCAAAILAAFFSFRVEHIFGDRQALNGLVIASILLNITLAYTYLITPHLAGFGLEMSRFDLVTKQMPWQMDVWHGVYWALETIKLSLGLTLLRWCYRRSCTIV